MSAKKKAANDAFEVVSDSIYEASEVMKAMSSETRLKILCALSEGGEMPVGQLADLTEQSHSAVSQHLAKLRAANLVESRRDGQTIYYRCSGGVGRALINTLCDFYR
ncbi:MAG: winged helix-turn-helix transcriptional regulator [Rhodobacterales bacterium]|jgi:DNA-binding transcriptional ArsR family regulator|nr:winged helix-turn-helix transcriptional regulator [Rhodobacterales bacterium]